MGIVARFVIGAAAVLVLAALALFLMRKDIVAATVEHIATGAGLEEPDAVVSDVSLTRLTIASLDAGSDRKARALALDDVVIDYDWRALLFKAKLKSVALSKGEVAVVIDDKGAVDIAGWTLDPTVKPAPPPFGALKLDALGVIIKTPGGAVRLKVDGDFDYAKGGSFDVAMRADKAAFAGATLSGAAGKGVIHLAADGAIAAQGSVKGDVATPVGAARGVNADFDAALASWRGFFGEAPRALKGAARLSVKSSTVETAATPSLAPLAKTGGAQISTLAVAGDLRAAFDENGYTLRTADGPLTIIADRGDRLTIEAADAPLVEGRGETLRVAVTATLEGPVARGRGRLAAASAAGGAWTVDASASLGRQSIGVLSVDSVEGAFKGRYAQDRLAGEADLRGHVRDAQIGRLRISDMPASGRFSVALDAASKTLTASPVAGSCLEVARAAVRMAEQDMDGRVTGARLCPVAEPLVAAAFGEPARTRVSGALTARGASYRLGKTAFDGAPPKINFSLDYEPAINTSRIVGDFAGGRVLLNDAFILSAAAGSFEGGVAGAEMEAKAALSSMRIAQNAKLEMVAPVLVSGGASLADDIARFDVKVKTPRGKPLGVGSGRHEVATGRGEAVFDSGLLTLGYGLQPDALLPALRGIISSATGTAEGRASFGWKPNEVFSAATVNLDNVSFGGPGVAVTRTEGVTGKIVFSGLAPVATAGEQTITIRKIDMDALKLENGDMRFSLPGDDTLKITKAEFPWFGGTIGVYNSTMSIAGKSETTLEIAGVDLGELLAYINVEGLSGKGVIKGTLPISFESGKARINNGLLSSEGSGVVRYEGKTTDAASQSNQQSALAFEVLRELSFDTVSASVDGPLDGELKFNIFFEGRGDIPVQVGKERQRVNSPVKYRIAINAPLLALIDQARLSTDIKMQIERSKLQEKAEEEAKRLSE